MGDRSDDPPGGADRDTPPERPSDGPPGRRARVAPQRVTLQFAGPKLTLPGEAATGDQPEDGPLHLDTSELDLPPAASTEPDDAEPPSLELDLDGLEGISPGPAAAAATDGWGRLRSSSPPHDPARIRSLTPVRSLAGPRGDDALSLVSERSRPPSTPGIDLGSEMADRYALGDFTGALRVAELLLGRDPDDVRAQKCAESSRERLIQLYSARLGSEAAAPEGAGEGGRAILVGTRVPRVRVPEHEIRWLGLDHRQGFLLSRLDGTSTIEDLVDLSGMTRLEVLRTLVELVEAGAIDVS